MAEGEGASGVCPLSRTDLVSRDIPAGHFFIALCRTGGHGILQFSRIIRAEAPVFSLSEKIVKFQKIFRVEPDYFAQAPGRVNLIGEHTDYCGGFVFPAAINRSVRMTASLVKDGRIRLFSEFHGQLFEAEWNTFVATKEQGWWNYFLAVASQFRSLGIAPTGLNVYIEGDVPLGAGLSSSAAFEVCAAFLISAAAGTRIPPKDLARLAQAAEHSEYVGVRCGIMDQFISALGRRNAALKIDCHSLEYEVCPFDSSKAAIVIINSMIRRGLVDSEYNNRRMECEEGLRQLNLMARAAWCTVRHIPLEDFEEAAPRLRPEVRKRLRHNLTENQRVHEFADALERADFSAAGRLLYQSHESLRDDFEVSCPQLDYIVAASRDISGVYGCRMTGAGFGGCAVALVEPAAAPVFADTLRRCYQNRFALDPEIHITPPCDGASVCQIAESPEMP